MRKILGMITVFIPAHLLACTPQQEILVIKRVIDGDTILFKNGKLGRLFGIDSPEFKDQYGNPTQGIERLIALRAQQKLLFLVQKHPVQIRKIKIDKYRRHVIKIQAHQLDLGLALVKAGLARVAYISHRPQSLFFTKDQKYYKKLLATQHQAYVKGVGLWARQELYKKIFPKKI